MLTKKYLQDELARRIKGIKPNVPTNTDVLIGELKSALMMVDCLPDDTLEESEKPNNHLEQIVCPKCGAIQTAKVEHTAPFYSYVHTCEKCGYTILESEWEHPNNHESLDEAAKAYALNTAEDSEQYSARYLGYKDGAKWQKEQDDKELSEKIAAAYQLGLADKEKQMMKEAVEGEYDKYPAAIYLSVPPPRMNNGDKVRVIVLPNTDEK